jgi:hypothetical protein
VSHQILDWKYGTSQRLRGATFLRPVKCVSNFYVVASRVIAQTASMLTLVIETDFYLYGGL